MTTKFRFSMPPVKWLALATTVVLTAAVVTMLALGLRTKDKRTRVKYFVLSGIAALVTGAVVVLQSADGARTRARVMDTSFSPVVRSPVDPTALFATAA